MAIVKRPTAKNADAAISAFIAGAPDAAMPDAAPKVPASKPALVAISLQMPAPLLAQVDEAARALSLTRSGFIKQALARAVQTQQH